MVFVTGRVWQGSARCARHSKSEKHEIRNKFKIERRKHETTRVPPDFVLSSPDFMLVSDFGFRASDSSSQQSRDVQRRQVVLQLLLLRLLLLLERRDFLLEGFDPRLLLVELLEQARVVLAVGGDGLHVLAD